MAAALNQYAVQNVFMPCGFWRILKKILTTIQAVNSPESAESKETSDSSVLMVVKIVLKNQKTFTHLNEDVVNLFTMAQS